jgi:hypothetical protein
VAAFAPYENVIEEGDLSACGWGPERSSGEQGFSVGHEYRLRYEVRAAVERRVPDGSRAAEARQLQRTP